MAMTRRSVNHSQADEPARLARLLPIAGWLPHYQKTWLSRDVIAGVAVWAVLTPRVDR